MILNSMPSSDYTVSINKSFKKKNIEPISKKVYFKDDSNCLNISNITDKNSDSLLKRKVNVMNVKELLIERENFEEKNNKLEKEVCKDKENDNKENNKLNLFDNIDIMENNVTLKKNENNIKQKRIINVPKKKLLNNINDDLNLNLKYSNFCKITKCYKMAKNRTDLCPLCDRYNRLTKKNFLNDNEKNEIRMIKKHKMLCDQQRNYYNTVKNTLKKNDCLIVLDFKENWTLPISKNQVQSSFYNSESISHLCIIVFLNNSKYVFNYFSYDLSHNSNFVIECLDDMFLSSIFDEVDNLFIFSDSGPHFRNSVFINYIFKENFKFFNCKKEINYFAEHHGKNECDSEFGNLTNIIDNNIKENEINSIDDLIMFFNKYYKENENNNNNKDISYSLYNYSTNLKTLKNLYKKEPKETELTSKKTYISPDVISFIERNVKTDIEDKNRKKKVMHLFLKHDISQCPIEREGICIDKMRLYLSFRYNGYIISSCACGDLNKNKYKKVNYKIRKEKKKDRKLIKNDLKDKSSPISNNIYNLINNRYNLFTNNDYFNFINNENVNDNSLNNNNNNNNYNNNNNNKNNIGIGGEEPN